MSAGKLHDIVRQVKNETRHREAKAFARNSRSSGDQGIIVGDMALLQDRLKDSSVDLFLTDPPYDQPSLYGRLAELAAGKLKPGGLCLAYSGQFHLLEVMEVMGRHLTYWWMFAIEFGGQHCAVHARQIQNKWKPIVAFAKPPVGKAPGWLSDLIEGGGRTKNTTTGVRMSLRSNTSSNGLRSRGNLSSTLSAAAERSRRRARRWDGDGSRLKSTRPRR